MHGPPDHCCHRHHWSRDSHYFLLRSMYSAALPWTTRTSRLPWFEYAHLCAFCQHNQCYSGFCVEPTSQPSHPVATDGCKASHQLWPRLCTGHFHRWHCEVGAGSVLGLCTRFVCGCCAHSAASLQHVYTREPGVGCQGIITRHHVFCRSAQCASARITWTARHTSRGCWSEVGGGRLSRSFGWSMACAFARPVGGV